MSRQTVASTFRVEETSTFVGNVVANGTGTNEQVTLQVTGTPTGGSFILFIAAVPVTITYNSTTTATATAINAALGGGSVSVAGGTFPGATQTITFSANYAGIDVPPVVLAVNGLTGGTAPSVTITTPVPGAASISATTMAAGTVSASRGIFSSIQSQALTVAAAGSSIFTRTADSASSAMVITASSHATSERAGITYGDWIVGQDLAGDGTKNFFFSNGSPRLQIGTGGLIKIGNAGESLRFVGDNSYLAFFEGTEVTRRAFLQATSTLTNLVSEVGTLDLYGSSQLFRIASGYALLNGYMRIGTWPANGAYTGLVDRASGGANNYMIMADTLDTYISSPGSTGVIHIRPRNNGTSGEVVVSNSGTSHQQQVSAGRNGGGAGGGATDANYYNATFYANPAGIQGGATGHTASIAFHPGGVAPQLRCGYNVDTIYVHNSVGTASTSALSGVLVNTSSRRYKTNIAEWPPRSLSSAAPSAIDIARQLRVTSFQFSGGSPQAVEGRRLEALKRLNAYTRRNNLPDYVLRDHDCGIDDCDGTPDDPCARVLNARAQHVGLIAEEVAEVMPEAVHLDANRQPEGIHYGAVTAMCIAAIQELIERVESIEASSA